MGLSSFAAWHQILSMKKNEIYSLRSICVLVVAQLISCVWLFATPWTAACQAYLSFLHYLSEFAQTHVYWCPVMPSNYLILCCPLLLLPLIFPSIRVSSSEPAFCIRWPKYWSFSFSISASNKSSGLISFRIDWFDLLTCQWESKSKEIAKNLNTTTLQAREIIEK